MPKRASLHHARRLAVAAFVETLKGVSTGASGIGMSAARRFNASKAATTETRRGFFISINFRLAFEFQHKRRGNFVRRIFWNANHHTIVAVCNRQFFMPPEKVRLQDR